MPILTGYAPPGLPRRVSATVILPGQDLCAFCIRSRCKQASKPLSAGAARRAQLFTNERIWHCSSLKWSTSAAFCSASARLRPRKRLKGISADEGEIRLLWAQGLSQGVAAARKADMVSLHAMLLRHRHAAALSSACESWAQQAAHTRHGARAADAARSSPRPTGAAALHTGAAARPDRARRSLSLTASCSAEAQLKANEQTQARRRTLDVSSIPMLDTKSACAAPTAEPVAMPWRHLLDKLAARPQTSALTDTFGCAAFRAPHRRLLAPPPIHCHVARRPAHLAHALPQLAQR